MNELSLIRATNTLVFSVKPQTLPEVMNVLAPILNPKRFYITILAGTPIARIEQYFSRDAAPRVARAMPNLGAFIRKSATALCDNGRITSGDRTVAENIFSSIGRIFPCREQDMDRFTAVCGSGPAYVFYFMETFIDAATSLGMDPGTAHDACLETLEGAAGLLARRDAHPADLRARVTSKGGTTEAALKVLESGRLKDLFDRTLEAARERAEQLGKQ
jgi:pyrroline-5-carboxylate reductase